MAYTFNGETKIISFDILTTEFDVQDLWSRYIDWYLFGDNSKYLPAMRNVGGDPLPGSKQLGLTYFLLNNWKIKPYEASHTLSINGNIYSEDGSSPYASVIGNYQVMLINSVSNLVDSTVQQLPEIEYASFNGGVTINATTGVPGTTYPIGTPLVPVNNLVDAQAIATARGFKQLYFIGNFTFVPGDYLVSYDLIGQGIQSSLFTFQNGSVVAYCKAYKAKLTGLVLGIIGFEDCHLFNYSSSGAIPSSNTIIANRCLLQGTLALPSNFTGKVYALDCWSIPTDIGGKPIFDMNNAAFSLQMRNYAGFIEIRNCSQPTNDVRILMNSGGVILDSTVTNGAILISGVTSVTNNSVGVNVDTSSVISTTSVTESIRTEVGAEIEYASFNNSITLDVSNGIAGTLYPIGTPLVPVNNLNDAKLIAETRGFKHINLLSNLTITSGQNIDELHIISDNWVEVIVEPGVSTQNTNFERISLYGEMDGFWNILTDCWTYDVSNFCGWLKGGSFTTISLAPYTIESEGQSFFDDVLPMYPGEYSSIICNINTSVAVSKYTGLLDIKSTTDGCELSIGFNTGKLMLDNTNTGGIIKVRGTCELVNNSNGTVVDDDSLNTVTISDTVWNKDITLNIDPSTAGYTIWNTPKKVVNRILPFLFAK